MEEKQLVNLVGAGNTESQEKLKNRLSLYTRCLETSEKNKLATISLLVLAILLGLFQLDQISLLMPRMLIILMVMKLRHIVIYHLNYQIAYHSRMVVLSFQVIRSLMMCILINQFQKTINLFWELTI